MNAIYIKSFLLDHFQGEYGHLTVTVILLTGIAALAVTAYYITKLILYLLQFLIEKSPTTWDDEMINHRLMKGISQLAPALVVYRLLPAFFTKADGDTITWIKTLTSFYILWAIIIIISRLIGNIYNAFHRRDSLRPYAVKGIFQMVRLIVYGIGIVIGISILIGKEPIVILTALGASAAVLMLIFKDTILGLVASVQLTANKMLHRGDWIIADSHKANGEVEDISLTTVKVRNWDNSITTIPPYALVSESFRNYQPMRRSGGRRVDRSIFIDVNTVRFLTPEETAHLADEGWLSGLDDIAQAGKIINLALLRRYLEHYLTDHPDVNTDMLLMIRQMEPTPSGLPLQLYFFTNATEWKAFERVQSDIFDHVYATVSRFGLRIFQTPAGTDLKALHS